MIIPHGTHIPVTHMFTSITTHSSATPTNQWLPCVPIQFLGFLLPFLSPLLPACQPSPYPALKAALTEQIGAEQVNPAAQCSPRSSESRAQRINPTSISSCRTDSHTCAHTCTQAHPYTTLHTQNSSFLPLAANSLPPWSLSLGC